MQSDLPDSVFAFPKQRKEPLTDAGHVIRAIARFDQVIGVSDEDRELAFVNITKAAEYYGIKMAETAWTRSAGLPSPGGGHRIAESLYARPRPRVEDETGSEIDEVVSR